MESARDLSNLSIAHEITVNPNFRVEPTSLPQGRYTNAGFSFSYCKMYVLIIILCTQFNKIFF